MAVHQAADTFTLVTGLRPDLDRMFASFTHLLGGEAH
jgi:shikimate 5-dehydrogenase